MAQPIDVFFEGRLEQVKNALAKNNFDAHVVASADEAKKLVCEEIIPYLVKENGAKLVAFGGSMSVTGTGIYDAVKGNDSLDVLDTYDHSISAEEGLERRRQALLSDIFITGTNAVVEDGRLVNLDGLGNRVAALAFGPKNVIIVVGRNKLVTDLEEAMLRIKEYAAPVNCVRLGRKTPCAKTTHCEDCSSPGRICNSWLITDKSNPKHRISVVLVNEDLGY